MDASTLTLADGRTIAYQATGPVDGPAVLLCHAAPGSRRFDPDPSATHDAGVRLITVDRPGYGGSDPLPADVVPTIPALAADAAAVLDHLAIGAAVVAGWSAGGRVAAALAAARPDLVTDLFVVATPAPDDEVPWIPAEHRAAITMMRADPVAATGQMAAVLGPPPADPATELAALTAGPADAAALERDPALRERVVGMLAESVRQGHAGVAADIVSYTVADWGFDPAAIGAPTTCVYGDADAIVTPAHGEWWAARIPEAAVEVVPGAGHLVIVDAWPRVLSAARRR